MRVGRCVLESIKHHLALELTINWLVFALIISTCRMVDTPSTLGT